MILRDTVTIDGTVWPAQVGRQVTSEIDGSDTHGGVGIIELRVVLPPAFLEVSSDVGGLTHHGRSYVTTGAAIPVYVRGQLHHVTLRLAASS